MMDKVHQNKKKKKKRGSRGDDLYSSEKPRHNKNFNQSGKSTFCSNRGFKMFLMTILKSDASIAILSWTLK